MDDRTARRRVVTLGHVLGLAAVLAMACVFVVDAFPRAKAELSDSHDGYNASIWGVGGRAIRERGPIESKFGGELRLDRETPRYAHHPPLIYSAVAASQVVVGDNALGARLPVFLGSLVSIVLLWRLALAQGATPLGAATGVVVAMSTPMLFVYGVVIDTGMLGLVFAIATLLAFETRRSRRGDAALAVVAFLCVVTSWYGVVFVGLLAVAALARWRFRDGPIGQVLALGGAATLGVAVDFAWIYWVLGSFSEVRDVFTMRRGTTIAWSAWMTQQRGYLADLVPFATALLPIAALAGLASRRARTGWSVSALTVLIYVLVFRQGSHHSYWNFWIVLPLGLGVAAAATSAERLVRPNMRVAVASALTAGAAILGVAAHAEPSDAGTAITGGRHVGELLARHADDLGETKYAYYTGPRLMPMVAFYAHRPGSFLDNAALELLARERPETMIVRPHPTQRFMVVRADEALTIQL